jgi:hypothetical protein
MIIIGAGLAGLLAGSIFQRARIFEAGPEDQINHRAVLRFRSRKVGDAVGIDFRPVTVHRGIWLEDKFVRPSIQLANLYSKKVIGKIMDRSIWKMEPVERWIAPENIVEQLAERCVGRIDWNSPFETHGCDFGEDDVVSTMPMPMLHPILTKLSHARGNQALGSPPDFRHQPITVRRWRVKNADVFQTIYFPAPNTGLYRASITGNLLIAEYIDGVNYDTWSHNTHAPEVMSPFGLGWDDIEAIDSTRQRFGKIAPIDDAWRRQFILWATMNHRVYSLGRFATWRNVLLDDVLEDIAVVKRIISGGAYHAAKSV